MRKNRVADWCDLTDLLYSQLSELWAHNRKVNMNQFSERFPNKVWDVNTADVLMIRCWNVCLSAPMLNTFSIWPKCYGPSIGCTFVMIRLAFLFPRAFVKMCTRAYRSHWSLLLFVCLCVIEGKFAGIWRFVTSLL